MSDAASRSELILKSQRASEELDSKAGMCSHCLVRQARWRYRESTWGEVILCLDCRDIVYDRSHGGRDAMSGALLGGAFEMDRRRH